MIKYVLSMLSEGEKESDHETAIEMTSENVRIVSTETLVIQPIETRKTLLDDFGFYETLLLFVTQVGYFPVAAAMLLTTYQEPSKEWCAALQNSTSSWTEAENKEFYSLTALYDRACKPDSNTTNTMMSSFLMWGAFVGSFVCGFLSDRFGRKPIYLGCLLMVSVGHLYIATANLLNLPALYAGLGVTGFFCGGYMVTNFVILTEAFELPRSRLLVVSMNGWSVGMAVTAVVAMLTRNWFGYHLTFSAFGLMLTILSYALCFESCRWLSANGKFREAKQTALQIKSFNRKEIDVDEAIIYSWYEILGFTEPVCTNEKKNWKALFKSSQFLKPTIVMFYSFLASSIVSFGFYFSLDVLPGNRYHNMILMGLLKFGFGFIPFFANNFLAKRTIAISSISLCCVCAFLILPIQFFNLTAYRWIVVFLVLIVSAGIDPTWKINHLYSAELFPTSVRSMARGVCNAGGRLGSVLAPMIVHFRDYSLFIPTTVFAVLLFVQLVVIFVFLPDDNDKEANEMNDE